MEKVRIRKIYLGKATVAILFYSLIIGVVFAFLSFIFALLGLTALNSVQEVSSGGESFGFALTSAVILFFMTVTTVFFSGFISLLFVNLILFLTKGIDLGMEDIAGINNEGFKISV